MTVDSTGHEMPNVVGRITDLRPPDCALCRGSDVAGSGLVDAAIALRDHLEDPTRICCAKFDIPDSIWVPFLEALPEPKEPTHDL